MVTDKYHESHGTIVFKWGEITLLYSTNEQLEKLNNSIYDFQSRWRCR